MKREQMPPTLPQDVARCDGINDSEGWREGCETCMRRIAPRGDRVIMMTPPPIIVFECEFLIEERQDHPEPQFTHTN